MQTIQDYNNDKKIDWIDYVIYGLTLTGNIILTILNIIH